MSLSVDPRIGSDLFGYRLESLLGRGGMGAVYKAYDQRLKRYVALKLIAPELSEDERFRERFLAESELAASLDHPNVVPIYDAGELDEQLYIAMRYVEGTDLKHLLRTEPSLDSKRALVICTQVAAALDAAHDRGLVHRDVKASNVLLDETEHVYLADFGLSRRLADPGGHGEGGFSLGTPAYAAPEQIEGGEVDGRADVYSLGCLLYECLTGSVPFAKESDLAVLWAHVNEPPPCLDTQPALEPVLKRALAKQPSDRYPTCGALVDAARAALPKPEPLLRGRRYKLIALVAAVLAGALAAGLVLGLGGGSNAKTDLTVRPNTLVRIDPRTNKITGVIGISGVPMLLVGPFDVAAAGKTVWIYNWADHTIRAIDAESNEPGRIVAVSGFPPSTGNSLAADKDGVWVLSSKGGAGILTRAKLGIALTREYTLRYGPLAVAVGAGSVWVSARSATGAFVLRIDPSTGEVLQTVKLPGAEIRSIAVGEGAVWTLQTGGVYRLDPGTAKVTGYATLPAYQVGQLAAGAGAVWATLQLPSGGTVLARIDPHTLQVRRIPLPKGQSSGTTTRVAVGRGSVWWEAPDAGVVYRVDPGSGRIVSAVHVTPPLRATADAEPVSVAAGADAVWVTVTFGFAP